MKNKTAIFGIIAALLIIGSTMAGIIISNQENNNSLPKEELVSYFAETASTKFINSIGQPIEGISPPMFLDLFPNLREQDLDGVQTALGFYKYENNQLVYKESGPQIHSAAYAITEEGFETLLDNLAKRFNITLKSKNSVDTIMDKLYEEPPGSKELSFRTIEKDTYNLLTLRSQRLVTSQTEWASLWARMQQTDGLPSNVDFNENMVIAVFQGQKPTSGYEIEITKIIERDNEIEVRVKETSPGPNCAADTVITSPHHIVELKKSNKTVKFIFEQEIVYCN